MSRHKKQFLAFTNGTPEGIKSFRNGFENARRRAGLKGVRFHDLRHTFGSRLDMTSASVDAIMDLISGGLVLTVRRRS